MAKKLTKVLLYPIIIEACEEGGYFARCPSLQGCQAQGESYSEAIENIESVIKAHLEVRKEHGEIAPSIEIKRGSLVSVNLPILLTA